MTGFLTGRSEARFPKPAKRVHKAKRPLRRKSKRKAKLHDADRLFSQYIRNRDRWCCACSSRVVLQCAHIVSRRYRNVRWNPLNAIALCQKHHMKWTHDPLGWEVWIEERYPGRLARLKAAALAGKQPVDYDAICAELRAAIGERDG